MYSNHCPVASVLLSHLSTWCLPLFFLEFAGLVRLGFLVYLFVYEVVFWFFCFFGLFLGLFVGFVLFCCFFWGGGFFFLGGGGSCLFLFRVFVCFLMCMFGWLIGFFPCLICCCFSLGFSFFLAFLCPLFPSFISFVLAVFLLSFCLTFSFLSTQALRSVQGLGLETCDRQSHKRAHLTTNLGS